MITYGKVYLLKDRGLFETTCKIGVTKNEVGQRKNEIVRSRNRKKKVKWWEFWKSSKMKKVEMKVVFWVPVFNYRSFEKRLHKRFEKYSKKMNRKFSGSTEIFDLNSAQRTDCILQMLTETIIQHLCVGLALFFLIFSIIKQYQL